MSVAFALGCDQESTEGKNRRDPRADEDAVQLVVHRCVVGKEQRNTEHEAGRRAEQDGDAKDEDWFHVLSLTQN